MITNDPYLELERRFARMSGSGATCFGLYDDDEAAMAAVRAIRQLEPGWWAEAG